MDCGVSQYRVLRTFLTTPRCVIVIEESDSDCITQRPIVRYANISAKTLPYAKVVLPVNQVGLIHRKKSTKFRDTASLKEAYTLLCGSNPKNDAKPKLTASRFAALIPSLKSKMFDSPLVDQNIRTTLYEF